MLFIWMMQVKQISDNEIYLLIKYVKIFLWRVAKRLSYIEDARVLKVNWRLWARLNFRISRFVSTLSVLVHLQLHYKLCSSFENVKARDSFSVSSRTLWSNSCIGASVPQTKSVTSPLKANGKHEDWFIDIPLKFNDNGDGSLVVWTVMENYQIVSCVIFC
jgi:hypothetical protein